MTVVHQILFKEKENKISDIYSYPARKIYNGRTRPYKIGTSVLSPK